MHRHFGDASAGAHQVLILGQGRLPHAQVPLALERIWWVDYVLFPLEVMIYSIYTKKKF